MAFTPDNYLTAARALDQIRADATGFHQQGDAAIDSLVRVATALSNMQANWLPAADYIDAQAAAFPADEHWLKLKERKDRIVTDFIAMRDAWFAVRDAAQAAR